MSEEDFEESARIQFGKQLKKYREIYKIPQFKFAEAMETDGSYIVKVEDGKLSVGIDKLEKFARFFGLKYYELGNPYFPLPSGKNIPSAVRDLKEKAKAYKPKKPKAERVKLSPYLDELLKTNFLKQPRTAKEIAEKLSNKVVVPEGRIAALLTRYPRNLLVRIVPKKEWGGRVSKYVLV